MRERRNRQAYALDIKSRLSHSSCLDVFSKVESLFLQKYFRYNLTDYFPDILLNIEEDLNRKKSKNQFMRQLLSRTFLVKNLFSISQMTERINQFYSIQSDTLVNQELRYSFKYLFTNTEKSTLKENELAIIEVKIKADVQKIQTTPQNFFRQLNQYFTDRPQLEDQQPEIFQKLRYYGKDSINFFVVYFGDINFASFNLKQYRVSKVRFLNRVVELKIYVFFVSRLSMVDTFKKMNKLEPFEHINDIMINKYELRRERAKSKRRMKGKFKEDAPCIITQKHDDSFGEKVKWAGFLIMGAVALGAVIRYFS